MKFQNPIDKTIPDDYEINCKRKCVGISIVVVIVFNMFFGSVVSSITFDNPWGPHAFAITFVIGFWFFTLLYESTTDDFKNNNNKNLCISCGCNAHRRFQIFLFIFFFWSLGVGIAFLILGAPVYYLYAFYGAVMVLQAGALWIPFVATKCSCRKNRSAHYYYGSSHHSERERIWRGGDERSRSRYRGTDV